MQRHSPPFTLALALASIALPLTPSAAGAQDPEPVPGSGQSFPAEVELVVVDVVVLDGDRNTVTGLSADDFVIREDGRPQTITSFEAIEIPDAPEPEATRLQARPPTPKRVSTNSEQAGPTGRSFAIVFDDIHMTPQNGEYARDAVGRFLETGVREGDVVTLVSTGGVWWSAGMLAGRDEMVSLVDSLAGRFIPELDREWISDYEAMRIWIYGDSQMEQRVERRYVKFGVLDEEYVRPELDYRPGHRGTYITGRAGEYYNSAAARNRRTLALLERVLEAQTLTRGRKSLILVSDGFIYDQEMPEFQQVARAARRANVAIYFVSARGLSGMPDQMTAQFQRGVDQNMQDLQDAGYAFFDVEMEYAGTETIASESGGFTIKNTNDLASGLLRVENESRNYYLIGYLPTNTVRDGDFREIDVKVERKGLRVRARKGYYAPGGEPGARSRSADAGQDADVQVALDSPFALPDIPLRMAAYVFEETLLGKARAVVAVEVDIGDLAFEQVEDRSVATLEYLLVVINRQTGEHFRYDEKVDMRLRPATRAAYEATWYPFFREFDLDVGGYQAKLVARDAGSRRIGTVIHEFEVPVLADLRVSTPILTESLQPAQGGKRLDAKLSARRTFWAGELLYCEFNVYGASADLASGLPQVIGGHEVRDAQGRTVFAAEATRIRPTSLGALWRLVGFSTEGLGAGDYVLRLTLQDQVAGQRLEVDEPFTLRSPDQPPNAASGGR